MQLCVCVWNWNKRGVFKKKQDCCNSYFITHENSKLQHVPFEVVFLSPDALLHSPPQRFHVLMGGFFRDRSELHVTAILMGVEFWEWFPFNTFLSWRREKSHRGLNPEKMVVTPARQYYFLPKISGCSNHCEQKHCRDGAAMTLSPTILSSFLDWTHETSQELIVYALFNRLALWHEFRVNNFANIKESDQHHLDFRLGHPCFLGLWWGSAFPFKTRVLGEWIVLEDLRFMTCNNPT